MLKNSKIAIKAIVPLVLMAVVAVGLVLYSTKSLDQLAKQTRDIVDLQAVRLEQILRVRFHVNDMGIQSRNLIIDTGEKDMAESKSRFDAARKGAQDAIDTLLNVADTPERKDDTLTLKNIVQEFVAAQTRSHRLGLNNEKDAAAQALRIDGTAARTKLKEFIGPRVDRLTAELRQARDDADHDVATARTVLIAAGTTGLFAAVALALSIVMFGITRPIGRLVTVLERMAQGAIEAEIKEAARGDEIGAVGRAVDGIKAMVARKAAEEAEVKRRTDEAALAERKRTMIELADGFERAVGGIVGQVSSAATELQATAQQMTSTAGETAVQSTAAAAAAEEAASNVGTVAAAAEELGASVQEIGRQVQGSATLAQCAMGEADQTAHLVQELNGAVARIGDVVGMISNIASQTNLLALNATIEAARAGEAGRGFAVVATEVKELAGQTARATGEIADQIGKVQAATSHAVAAIGSITDQIREINVVATTIAAAVEEQGAATQEIVRNVAQAAAGTGEVTGNIAGVAQASEDTGAAATQVLASSSELARQSEHLTAEVSRFLSTVRAA